MPANRDAVKSIFGRALDIESAEERAKYLDQACGDADQLRAEVDALLDAIDQAGDFLGRGSASDVTATIDQPFPEQPGTTIGPYKLLQVIGEGGMGVVYMAEQTTPVERRVALKIIKPGMDSRQVIARFEAERQALAMMDHPNIAKVLDGGATESGRPYFVMELVNGIPLTEYCDEQHLAPKERLELFVPICQAVQHAHQKGIIHRDLKPSNVLVALYDHEPVPKVIDFGVAKATSQNLTEKTLFTQFGQVVGTLEYMSPEQARRNQLDIDTRSDVYSLGVMLYELLTGTTPFDKQRLRSAGFDEMLRIIREEEPLRPSMRLSSIETLPSVAANRRTEPGKLRTLVRGELDWIVMKALDKDRARRYETATNFGADIDRYLRNEAVLACPPSIAYRCRKFVRRNRGTFLAASTVLVALLLGLAGTAWQAARAQQTERRTRAEQLVKSLQTIDVGNIPTTLALDIEGLRRWVDPLLQDEIAKAEDGSAAKLHFSLALLPVDESQIDYLSRQLPICTLEQSLVVRDALFPHRDRITDSLWQLMQDQQRDDPQRLQVAGALATYDPENPRWQEIRDRVTADLVAVSPAYLGTWKDALQPVAEWLIEPLSTVYRDPQRDDVARSLATAVLADYAGDNVDTLTELVVNADTKQFRDLFPVLHQHGASAVSQLKEVLDESIVAKWDDLAVDPSWPRVEPAARRTIESAQGIVNERFAVCQTMPLEQFLQVAESLRPSGYRPVRLRPFSHDGSVLVAAVWTRDSRDWRLVARSSAESVIQRDEQLRSEGFAAVDVAGFLAQSDQESLEEQYSCVWVKRRSDADDARINVGVSESEIGVGVDYGVGSITGFRLQQGLQSFRNVDGRLRYCGVWAKAGGDVDSNTSSNQTPLEYDQSEYPGKIVWDIDVSNAAKTETTQQRYARQLADAQSKLETAPDELAALLDRAVAEYYLGRDESALEHFSALIEKNSADREAYFYRAVVHARSGKSDEAKEDLARFTESMLRSPPVPQIHIPPPTATKFHYPVLTAYLDAVVAAHLKQDTGGMEQLERFIAQNDDNTFALYAAACAYSIASGVFRSEDSQKSSIYADRAVELLKQVLSRGYGNVSDIQSDPDIDPLREDAGFLAVMSAHRPDRRYAIVWQASSQYESEDTHGLSPQENLQRLQALQARDYRPVAISAASIGETEELVTASVWHRPIVADEAKETLAQRQANAAIALLRMGEHENVWPLLKHSPDPRVRTWIIHRLHPAGASFEAMARQLETESDESIRRALILALGEYGEAPPLDQRSLVEQLLYLYEHDADPGIHAAAEWTLRQWHHDGKVREIAQRLAAREVNEDRNWYVTRQGHTFVTFRGPIEFFMGSPSTEKDHSGAEKMHRKLIDRSFAITSTEVTCKQFRAFLEEEPRPRLFYSRAYAPDDDCPQVRLTWYRAAAYCRWLSEKEGVPLDQMCYPKIPEIKAGMKLPADYLTRTGYRLPTEAEWEFACRAGAETTFCYGQSEELLAEYSRYAAIGNGPTWPVGSLKPNDFGLFDMHGNVAEWCQGSWRSYRLPPKGKASPDTEDLVALGHAVGRIMRGGAYSGQAEGMRSALRSWVEPGNSNYVYGFRLARTYHALSAP